MTGKVHLQLKNTERAVACAALRTAFQNMDPEKELISFTEVGVFNKRRLAWGESGKSVNVRIMRILTTERELIACRCPSFAAAPFQLVMSGIISAARRAPHAR
ncbi:hypothetical protein Bbelb_363630 [Branchiostoma belcheri]|nr:hypothetical protein Bbelb_363630 [Branchiostoma belcheri]